MVKRKNKTVEIKNHEDVVAVISAILVIKQKLSGKGLTVQVKRKKSQTRQKMLQVERSDEA